MSDTPVFGRRQPASITPQQLAKPPPTLAELGIAPSTADADELKAWNRSRRAKYLDGLRSVAGLRIAAGGLILAGLLLRVFELGLLGGLVGAAGSACLAVAFFRARKAS